MNDLQDSVFQFVGIGMPAASARGVTCSFKPLAGKIIEMLDGTDLDVSRAGSRKFVYSVRGSDVWVPPFAGLWEGSLVTVDLPCLFVEPVGIPQQRAAVPGSLFFIDADHSAVVPEGAAAFRCYNPRSVCHVRPWTVEDDPDGAIASWSIELRERNVAGT